MEIKTNFKTVEETITTQIPVSVKATGVHAGQNLLVRISHQNPNHVVFEFDKEYGEANKLTVEKEDLGLLASAIKDFIVQHYDIDEVDYDDYDDYDDEDEYDLF